MPYPTTATADPRDLTTLLPSPDRTTQPDATAAISVRGLRKKFGTTEVLHGLDFDVPAGSICGLLGRNGAGKTTAMTIMAGQDLASAGQVRVFGQDPYENATAMSKLCFARENQKYPESFRVRHILQTAPWFYSGWSETLADSLVEAFRLPTNTQIKALSRGQLSAVAIIVAMASRAPVTFLDEPYLGLDATARQLFYDALLTDYMAHPRTILMSTHLIDEAAELFEKVIVIDAGRIVLDADSEDAQSAAYSLAGAASAVEPLVPTGAELHRRRIGGLLSVTIAGQPDDATRAAVQERHLELSPISLQDLVAALGTGGPNTFQHPETSKEIQ